MLIHVNELTQPQGHSTSGSHERYKTSEERLKWEQSNDCNLKFRDWIISNDIATDEEITANRSKFKKERKRRQTKCMEKIL